MRAAFTSPEGLTRISGEAERRVSFPVVMVVTDERILFVAGDQTDGEIGADAGSLAYDDLAAVAIEGTNPSILALSMANGVRWEFPLPDADPEVVDSVVRHLRWVGELRSRLVACRNDLELAAGEIRACADAMDWDEAEAVYAEHRESLDQLIGAVQWTKPIADDVIAPELTEMERTLERAYARLCIEHAQSQLELGQQLIENEDYDQARKVLQTAQQYYDRASGRADAIERGDAFRFGEQRELLEELDRLEWEIEAVAAEPIRRAHEAKIMGKNATQTAVAVDHWETAFRRYGNVLTLDWGTEGRSFAGDPAEIRAEMHRAAATLVDIHTTLARTKWNEGVTLERNDDIKNALRACTDATDHLDRAAELAAEFRPDDASAVEQRRDEMKSTLQEMRDTGTVDSNDSEPSDPDSGDQAADTEQSAAEPAAESEQSLREAEDLLTLDTHQEITFDATVEGEVGDDGRRDQRDRGDEETGNEGDSERHDDRERVDGDSSETVVHSDGSE
ncbi:MAG: hypothetical protein V5A45_03650 [Haloarculaceae archaeon]